MTTQKSFKRLVRARMEKTGESYTAARATLLAAGEAKTGAPALTMSDEAIRRGTGRGWEEWFDLLDEWGGEERTHKEIATMLREEHAVGGWWAQSVTVSFERARGMRAVGERPAGFSVTAQKTVAVPVERLFDALADASQRARWLPGAELRERTATRPRSARFDWGDGATRLIASFSARGAARSAVALEHERLPDAAEAERMKTHWRERLAVLAAQLERTVASRDGTPIAYERAGEGPALVLVDGALCFRGFGPMGPLAERLAPHFTVYRYDRRGRGESGDTAPYAVAREVEDLAAVIAAAGGSAAVVGMSSGAVLALEAAASGLPITRLALYEPPLSADGPDSGDFGATLERLVAAGRRGDAVEFFLTSAGVPQAAVAGMRSDPSWALFESVAPTLVYDNAVLGDGSVPRERAATLALPTLVAAGADSPDFFRRAAEATAEAIPSARYRALAGQSWGQVSPDALAPVLRQFLTDERVHP